LSCGAPGPAGIFDDLTAGDALELLAAASDPDSAAQLSRSRIGAALKRVRHRDVEAEAERIQAVLRSELLTQPPPLGSPPRGPGGSDRAIGRRHRRLGADTRRPAGLVTDRVRRGGGAAARNLVASSAACWGVVGQPLSASVGSTWFGPGLMQANLCRATLAIHSVTGMPWWAAASSAIATVPMSISTDTGGAPDESQPVHGLEDPCRPEFTKVAASCP